MKTHLFSRCVLLVICVSTLNSVCALPYKYLESIQFQNCPHKNRCALIENAAFSDRLCECDYEECSKFGDCCIDFARPNSTKSTRHTCMHYGNFTHQGVYVVNTCPIGYSDSKEVTVQCQQNNFSDPFMSVPVTDASSGETYLNRYCAICNGVSPSSMATWKSSFVCDDEDLDVEDLSWDSIKYNLTLKKWGYDQYGQFSPCKFIYDKPPSVSVTGRPCRSNLISSCSNTWTRPTYRRECDSYMAVVTDRAIRAYKNPHCALCNNIQDKELMCLATNIADRVKVDFNHAILVDINWTSGNKVGVSKTEPPSCPEKHMIPLSKSVRLLAVECQVL